MKKFLSIVFALVLVHTGSALAQDKVVIELFTSQGCDMCPPAHILQKDYSQMDEAVTLTWHVEYWDFMGWKDTYARPEFSKRQYDYNKAAGRKGVFTPQVLINGRNIVIGKDKQKVYSGIESALAEDETPVDVKLRPNGDGLEAVVGGDRQIAGVNILLVWVKKEDRIKVTAGANVGNTFDFMNIVRHFDIIGTMTDRQQTFPVNLSNPNRGDADAVAILVQDGAVGPIYGADFLDLDDLANSTD
jgi:hypothetical protein